VQHADQREQAPRGWLVNLGLASTVKEGDVVSQNGQRYRYTGGQYVLIP